MRINEPGHQVEPMTIDCLGSFLEAEFCLRADLIDPVIHNNDGLAGNCSPILYIDDSDINCRADFPGHRPTSDLGSRPSSGHGQRQGHPTDTP